MKSSIKKAIDAYIRERYPLDHHIERAASLANFDLYFSLDGHDVSEDDPDYTPLVEAKVISGVAGEDASFDFSAATQLIADYVESLPSTLYVESESEYVLDSEPESEEVSCEDYGCKDEECSETHYYEPEPYYMLETRDIKAIMFGRELSQYV